MNVEIKLNNTVRFTYNFALKLGLNLCLITANYYMYTAAREEDRYVFETLLAFPKSRLDIAKHK